jgi:GrpB-like predicted nucleotidyltransferase (UPF0157 family)
LTFHGHGIGKMLLPIVVRQARTEAPRSCQQGSGWERRHLLFRDYLRASVGAREAYAVAKREAARLWAGQRAACTEAKSEVILDLLDWAEAWAGATGWVM